MEWVYTVCGLFNLSFAIFHLFFWKLFKWDQNLKSETLSNRAILQIFNVLLIYLFLVAGIGLLLIEPDFWKSKPGQSVLLVISGFWTIRLILQFIYLRVNHALVHVLTGVFSIGVIIHFLSLLEI